MLLARVAAELRVGAELGSHLVPVRFMEESDEVFNAADFWLEVLFYLALAVDKQDLEFAQSLRDTRADLTSRWRERELDERARAAVIEAADRLGKRLVLMVENLQALCANADGDFGWKLRKTLQTSRRSSWSPPPPAASRGWTMPVSRSSNCSESFLSRPWIPPSAAASGRS